LQLQTYIGDRATVQLKAVSKMAGMLPMPEVVLWRLDGYKYVDAKTLTFPSID